MKIGEKYLFRFASQSCGFTGEVEFEGEVIDMSAGAAIVKSDYFDRFWIDAGEIVIESLRYDKTPPYKKKYVTDEIRLIKKL